MVSVFYRFTRHGAGGAFYRWKCKFPGVNSKLTDRPLNSSSRKKVELLKRFPDSAPPTPISAYKHVINHILSFLLFLNQDFYLLGRGFNEKIKTVGYRWNITINIEDTPPNNMIFYGVQKFVFSEKQKTHYVVNFWQI
jgi:hypothetical protein